MDKIISLALAISNSDVAATQDIFSSIPLNSMKRADEFIGMVADICAGSNQPKCLQAILALSDSPEAQSVDLSSATRVLRLYTLKNPDWLIANAPLEYFETMKQLADDATGPPTELACNRLLKYYGLPTVDVCRILKAYILEDGILCNYTVLNHVNTLLKQISPTVSSPWVHHYLGGPLPTIQSLVNRADKQLPTTLVFEVFDPYTYADLVTSEADLDEESLLDLREQLYDEYTNLSHAKRIKACEPIVRNFTTRQLWTNVEIYRSLGPVNASPITPLLGDNICTRYGGCRMFTCNEYHETEEEEHDITFSIPRTFDFPWFKGYCEECYNRIVSYHHAVRRPMPDGAWQGCFCSWICVAKRKCQLGDDGVDLSRFEVEMIKVGIQDRIV